MTKSSKSSSTAKVSNIHIIDDTAKGVDVSIINSFEQDEDVLKLLAKAYGTEDEYELSNIPYLYGDETGRACYRRGGE